MNEYASESDSEYTNYWRDWEHKKIARLFLPDTPLDLSKTMLNLHRRNLLPIFIVFNTWILSWNNMPEVWEMMEEHWKHLWKTQPRGHFDALEEQRLMLINALEDATPNTNFAGIKALIRDLDRQYCEREEVTGAKDPIDGLFKLHQAAVKRFNASNTTTSSPVPEPISPEGKTSTSSKSGGVTDRSAASHLRDPASSNVRGFTYLQSRSGRDYQALNIVAEWDEGNTSDATHRLGTRMSHSYVSPLRSLLRQMHPQWRAHAGPNYNFNFTDGFASTHSLPPYESILYPRFNRQKERQSVDPLPLYESVLCSRLNGQPEQRTADPVLHAENANPRYAAGDERITHDMRFGSTQQSGFGRLEPSIDRCAGADHLQNRLENHGTEPSADRFNQSISCATGNLLSQGEPSYICPSHIPDESSMDHSTVSWAQARNGEAFRRFVIDIRSRQSAQSAEKLGVRRHIVTGHTANRQIRSGDVPSSAPIVPGDESAWIKWRDRSLDLIYADEVDTPSLSTCTPSGPFCHRTNLQESAGSGGDAESVASKSRKVGLRQRVESSSDTSLETRMMEISQDTESSSLSEPAHEIHLSDDGPWTSSEGNFDWFPPFNQLTDSDNSGEYGNPSDADQSSTNYPATSRPTRTLNRTQVHHETNANPPDTTSKSGDASDRFDRATKRIGASPRWEPVDWLHRNKWIIQQEWLARELRAEHPWCVSATGFHQNQDSRPLNFNTYTSDLKHQRDWRDSEQSGYLASAEEGTNLGKGKLREGSNTAGQYPPNEEGKSSSKPDFYGGCYDGACDSNEDDTIEEDWEAEGPGISQQIARKDDNEENSRPGVPPKPLSAWMEKNREHLTKIEYDIPPPNWDQLESSQSSREPSRVPIGYHDADLDWPPGPRKEQFIASRGNEYFCDIDEEYLTDRFNLTGLNAEVQYFQYALDLVTDVLDLDCDDDMREQIEKAARHLYGLVHARYIVTTRGLQKMVEKFKKGDFGRCPRVACENQHLLPTGQHDNSGITAVKLYCAKCEDLYNPKSSKHAAIDGAYFGTSFHSILFQVYPQLMPPKTQRRYEPKIFGFRVHAAAALARWQAERREEMKERLENVGVETGFEAEDQELMEEDEEEEMEDGEEAAAAQDGIDDMFEGPTFGAAGPLPGGVVATGRRAPMG